MPYLEANLPLETQVFFKAGRSEDRQEPRLSFLPNRQDSTNFSIGAQRGFSTGTSVSLELSHGSTEQGTLSSSSNSFYETRGILKLQQRLWRDVFGYGTRRALSAGALLTQGRTLGYLESVETGVMELVHLYYGAWLAQAECRAAASNLRRRHRLLLATQIKQARGTAESPDMLQVQSAHLQAQVQIEKSNQILDERWRELVTTLKLPEKWLSIDPKEIPVDLDLPMDEAMKNCTDRTIQESTSEKRSSILAEASNLQLERAENLLKPNLDLDLSLFSNGIDGRTGPSIEETGRRDHPGWSLGITLSLPLEGFAEKAALHTAIADQIKASAELSIQRKRTQLEWVNLCSNLNRLHKNYALLEEAFKNQIERERLEEKRFVLGRVQTLFVIQAGDDATSAELAFRNSEVELRLVAWQMRKLLGRIPRYLEEELKIPIRPETGT